MNCGYCSYKLEPFLDISLSLDIPLSDNDIYGTNNGTFTEGLLDITYVYVHNDI